MSEQKQAEKILLEKLSKALGKRGYQYEMPLGRGSFGLVVKAKDLNVTEKNIYAIKCLPLVYGETAKYRERELKILQEKGIEHKNIVKYGKYWPITIDNSQFLCISMECCRVNLKAFIYNNKMGGAEIITSQGPPRFYQCVFRQILEGLVAIHDMGWVHRDIHPLNILIANPNPEEIGDITIKIADFGLARDIRPTTSESSLLTEGSKLENLSTDIGNKDFRAPELDDGYYDYKVDLYSAGIVLYLLSRYLVQGQWKDEIRAFVEGRRSSEDLYHQDDKHLVRLISLLMQKREKRPTAKEALKIAEKLGESTEHVESQMLVEPKRLEFLVKKDGERAFDRFWIKVTILTLSNLKAKIEKCTGIKADSQVLCQKTNDAERINIKSDEDVEHIFKEKKPVVIIASDSTKVENRDLKRFRVKRLGESIWERCSTPDYTLSSLKEAIQDCLGVKVESQKLEQQQTKSSGKDCTIAIRTDENVEEMFESAEKKQDPVEIVVSDADAEAIMQKKTKTFLITKAGESISLWCSIQECTLSSLKEEIKTQTGIPTDLQVLHQLKLYNTVIGTFPLSVTKM